MYTTANGLDDTRDADKIKASFLLLMGVDAFEINKTKRKADTKKMTVNSHFLAETKNAKNNSRHVNTLASARDQDLSEEFAEFLRYKAASEYGLCAVLLDETKVRV